MFPLLVSLVGLYPFSSRLILFLLPFLILLVVTGVQVLSQHHGKAVKGVLVILLLASPFWTLPDVVSKPIEREDIKPLHEHLRTHRQSGDRVYLYYYARPAFRYYSCDWTLAEVDGFYEGTVKEEDALAFADDIHAVTSGGRVWFLFSHAIPKRISFFLSQIPGEPWEIYKELRVSLYLYDVSEPNVSGS